MNSRSRKGFTLVEIMVVLSISVVVAAITLGGFSSIRQSNRRTTCQTNLTQIYQACRVYQRDYDSFPYYDPSDKDVRTPDPGPGIGLWALYTYPKPLDTAGRLAGVNSNFPLRGYLRNVGALHCPNDNYLRNDLNTGTDVLSSELYADTDKTVYNTGFLSYQIKDHPAGVSTDYWTYDAFAVAADAPRQLIPDHLDYTARIPPEDTVVLWCRFHRKLDTDGDTLDGARNFDNVLFYDGSIQSVPDQEYLELNSPDYGTRCTDLLNTYCKFGQDRKPKPAQ